MSPLTGLSKRQLIIPGLFRAGPHCGGPDGPCLARPLYVSKFVEATTKGLGTLASLWHPSPKCGSVSITLASPLPLGPVGEG